MALAILIIGESGTGKSTAIKTLDPKETGIIAVRNKPLPFRGWKKLYYPSTKEKRGNYRITNKHTEIIKSLLHISEKKPNIKNVIIDDFQYIMATEFMNRALENGWGKFTEIASHVWDIFDIIDRLRDDLNIFFLSHSEVSEKDGKSRMKTIGKMLNEKITVEGLFTVVLHSDVSNGKYFFKTQSDETTVAKSPMEMFDKPIIPNDLQLVVDSIHKYNEGE